MPGFADDYEQQRLKQMNAFGAPNPHAEMAVPANQTSVKPPDTVLTKWGGNACAGPDASIV